MVVPVVVVRAIIERAGQLGLDVEKLLKSAGLTGERLGVEEPQITREQYERLLELALQADEAMGLHLAESARPLNLIAHLVVVAPTMRAALASIERFRELDGPCRYALSEHDGLATLTVDFAPGPFRCQRFEAEFVMVGLRRMMQFFDQDAAPKCADFHYPAPPHRAEYTRFFSGSERFDRPRSSLTFSRDLLDRPQIHHEPEIYSALEERAQVRLARLTRDRTYSERVLDVLLDRGDPEDRDMSVVAAAVGVSVRSLRRRLAEEGVSYNAVVERALTTLAERFLRDEARTLEDVAQALGFADRSAFGRAFKRWTGTTPAQYRRRRQPISA